MVFDTVLTIGQIKRNLYVLEEALS